MYVVQIFRSKSNDFILIAFEIERYCLQTVDMHNCRDYDVILATDMNKLRLAQYSMQQCVIRSDWLSTSDDTGQQHNVNYVKVCDAQCSVVPLDLLLSA